MGAAAVSSRTIILGDGDIHALRMYFDVLQHCLRDDPQNVGVGQAGLGRAVVGLSLPVDHGKVLRVLLFIFFAKQTVERMVNEDAICCSAIFGVLVEIVFRSASLVDSCIGSAELGQV